MKNFTIPLILFLSLILCGCSNDEPLTKRQRLLQSVAEIEKGFEDRVLGDVLKYISQAYHDQSNREFEDIKKVIHIQMLRHKSLHVFSNVKDIQWTDDKHATVEIVAAMGAKPIESVNILTSIKADMAKFTVDFVLENDIYKVKSVQWSWAEPSDFL